MRPGTVTLFQQLIESMHLRKEMTVFDEGGYRHNIVVDRIQQGAGLTTSVFTVTGEHFYVTSDGRLLKA